MTASAGGADLHLHTLYSDGAFTPPELVEEAVRAELEAIAVTDHDTLDGIAPVQAAATGSGIEVIAGTELSAQAGLDEIHILGLFVQPDDPTLSGEVRRYQERRRRRIVTICDRLAELGVPLEPAAVLTLAGGHAPGRLHVAQAMLAAGLVRNIGEAFALYLGNQAPAYIPKERPAAARAIELIHLAGGVAVMAHPGVTNRDDVIPDLATAGIDALEAYAPPHTIEQTEHYLDTAAHFALLVSAGSDCHGRFKKDVTVGGVRLDAERLRLLRTAAERRRQMNAAVTE